MGPKNSTINNTSAFWPLESLAWSILAMSLYPTWVSQRWLAVDLLVFIFQSRWAKNELICLCCFFTWKLFMFVLKRVGHVCKPSRGLLCGADCSKTQNGFPSALYWSYEACLKNTLVYNSEEVTVSIFTLSLSRLLFLFSLQGCKKTGKKRNVRDIWTLADKVGVRVFQLQKPSGAAAEPP